MITIAELRARHDKMTQGGLAKEMGVTQGAVSRWEKDITTIPGDKLKKLCLFFNVSSDDLLGLNKKNE